MFNLAPQTAKFLNKLKVAITITVLISMIHLNPFEKTNGQTLQQKSGSGKARTVSSNTSLNNSVEITQELLNKVFPTLEIENLVDEEFIFAPLPEFERVGSFRPMISNASKKPVEASKYVGRTIKIVKVEPNIAISKTVTAIAVDTKEQLIIPAVMQDLRGLVSARELRAAKNLLIGRSVWVKGGIVGVYNAQRDAVVGEYIAINPTMALKVVNVEPALRWRYAPFRIVMTTATGKTVYVDVSLSGTNIHKEARRVNERILGLSFSQKEIQSITDAQSQMCEEWREISTKQFAWEQARWGMTAEDLQIAFKGRIIKNTKVQSDDNAHINYMIPSLDLNNQKHDVFFEMDSYAGCLKRITLNPSNQNSELKEQTANEVNKIKQLLIQKYGEGLKIEDKKYGVKFGNVEKSFGVSDKFLWKNGITNIELNSVTINPKTTFYTLVYSPNNLKDTARFININGLNPFTALEQLPTMFQFPKLP